MSSQPDPISAKHYLKKALQLQKDHPVANYRYAYLLYRNGEYSQAAGHFQKALVGSINESLNDSQALIANMFIVNCGVLMAKEAVREVQYMKENQYCTFDTSLIENYADNMLIDSEEMLAQHIYCKTTSTGTEHIAKEAFFAYEEEIKDNEVLLFISEEGYIIKYREMRITLVHSYSFYVLYSIICSEQFIQGKDIIHSI